MVEKSCRGVRYVSLHGKIGYFVAAKRLMMAMIEAGIPLTWTPVTCGPGEDGQVVLEERAVGDRELDPYCNRSIEYDTVIVHTVPEFYERWIRRERGKRMIGHTVWETDSIPPRWTSPLNRMDHVLVPSRWNKEIFQRDGVTTPITVLPHILGPAAPDEAPFWDEIPPDVFVFYAIETWTARKNLDETIRLYRKTFTGEDKVLFVVKTSPLPFQESFPVRWPVFWKFWSLLFRLKSFWDVYGRVLRRLGRQGGLVPRKLARERLKKIEDETPGGGRVHLVTGDVEERVIEGLHRRGDCYLSLTHGEGWGLGAFDAAAAGNPVIATGWGGTLEFLDSRYAGVVGYDPVPAREVDMIHPCRSGHRWAQPRLEEAAEMMRAVAADPPAARAKARAWRSRLELKFSAGAVVETLKGVLTGDESSRAPSVSHSEAPNQYLFVFGLRPQKEPFHLCHYLCIESCCRVNHPERILFFYEHEPWGPYWELAKKRLTLVKVKPDHGLVRFRYGWRNRGCRPYRYAHLSDFIRLEKLLEYGGVYADMDTLFVNPLPSALRRKPFVLGREGDVVCQTSGRIFNSLCNAVIVSPPGAEFGRRWLDEMPGAFDGSWSNHSTLLPWRLSEEIPQAIHIEPVRSFYPYLWTREDIQKMLEGCDRDMEGIYSMHLWSHLWWSRDRQDFSSFHEGKLTERYIREVDTTYNLVARRFLP